MHHVPDVDVGFVELHSCSVGLCKVAPCKEGEIEVDDAGVLVSMSILSETRRPRGSEEGAELLLRLRTGEVNDVSGKIDVLVMKLA